MIKGKEDPEPPKEDNPDDDDFASLKEQSINLKNKMEVAKTNWPQGDAIEEVNAEAWEAERDAKATGNS